MTPLAVTGFGVVSTLGVGKEAWLKALCDPAAAREGAQRKSQVLDPEKFPEARTEEVWDWDPKRWLGEKGHRNFDRLTKFQITAAKHALEDAGIKEDGAFKAHKASRVGISSATAYGSLDAITELKRVAELEEPRYINPTRFPNTVINASAGYVSIWEGLEAPNTTLVDGNCGALDAVLNSETHLAHNRGDAFLVGGGEVISEALYVAFSKLDVMSGTHSEGLTLGEGACYLVVERAAEAKQRKAQVLAELIGYGAAFDSPESEALLVHPSPEAVFDSMQGALADAGLQPGDIDLVCSAMSGLEAFDQAEHEGVARLFGTEMAVVSPKQILGETFGAAGAFAMAAVLAWFDGCELPLLEGKAPDVLDTVLVNAVGYYGNVTSVVMRRPESGS